MEIVLLLSIVHKIVIDSLEVISLGFKTIDLRTLDLAHVLRGGYLSARVPIRQLHQSRFRLHEKAK